MTNSAFEPSDYSWTIQPGQTLLRSELHDLYGGGRRGGMEPSAKTPNVFLFTNVAEGKKYGYNFDGWHTDGTFHYTGEGTVGDQVMTHGNRATRDHIAEGRAIRLFESVGTSVTYIGEFSVPDESHVLPDESLDVNQSEHRSVFVFRLKPVGQVWNGTPIEAPNATLVANVPIEASNVESYIHQRSASEPVIALRREAELVARYVLWLEKTTNGVAIRQSIPTPAGHLMYTDVFVVETQTLIEAKSSSSRHHIRYALGQLLDYARYVTHTHLDVLTPTRPEPAMIELLHSYGVGVIWETSRKGKFDCLPAASVW